MLLDPSFGATPMAGDPGRSEFNQKNLQSDELKKMLDRPIAELELSVRARNCLDSANLQTLKDLVIMSEAEVMKLKNLGKTSLTEIKNRLAEKGLSLGMSVPQ